MLLGPEELENEERELIDNFCHLSPDVKTAQELALSFIGMVRERRAERFDGWIAQAAVSRIPELKSFADSLELDQQAVVAALTHEWSNGTTEGHINRLKTLKRAMYGRAKFDLLRIKVLAGSKVGTSLGP